MRRFLFFMLVNFGVVITLTILLRLMGVDHYITANGLNYTSLAIFSVVFGSVGSIISLMTSKWMAKRFMGVQIIDANGPYADIYSKVARISQMAGLPQMPEVGVYDSPVLNAFATGPSKSNSLVAVSTGLLSNMTESEVEGVLAHEVAHIANGDMVTMTLIHGILNSFVIFFSKIAGFALAQAIRGDDDEAPSYWTYFIAEIFFQVVFGILAMIVVNFFSRSREYRADAGAARYVGSDKMIAALKRLTLNADREPTHKVPDGVKALQIFSHQGFAKLFSTHPPLEDRIAALAR